MKFFITGGSSGLGKAIATALAANDENKVIITYRSNYPKALAELENVNALQADFSKNEDLQKAVEFLSQNPVDCIINNYHAGYQHQHITKVSSEEALSSFSKSIAPVFDLNNAVIPHFKKRKSGLIINILSSVTVTEPSLGMGLYSAEKKYHKEVHRHWAIELEKFGVKVIAVSPGLMKTNFNKHLDERLLEMMEQQGEFTPINVVVEVVQELIKNPEKFHGNNIVV